MKQNKRLLLFFAVMVMFNMAASFAHPVTPTLIVERQLDSSMFGVALAAMMTANFLMSPFWGKLCGYIPTKRVMLICAIGYSIGQVIFGMATTEVQVVGGRLFAGIFTGGMFTSFSNYVINTSSDARERGQNLTIMVTIQNVAGAMGYFVGGMLGLISVEAAFVAQSITLAVAGVLFFIICMDDTPFKHKPEKPLSIKEANPFSAFAAARKFMTPMLGLIFAIVAISAIGQNSFEQCFNYYIKDQFGLSSAYNGIFKAIIAVVTLIANSTVCIWMVKRTDTNRSFFPIMCLSTVALGSILFFNTLIPFVIVDVTFFTLNAIRLPLLQNQAAPRATTATSTRGMGVFQSSHSLGGIFGALFAGLIYDANVMLPFILAAAAFAVATGISSVYGSKYKKESTKTA